jgi:hypothetical protein
MVAHGTAVDGALAASATICCVSVESHFAKQDPSVLATYRRVLDVVRALGPVAEEAKKASIHLVRHTAFAGIATRRSALVLTLK